jgi:UDP-N-acetylmuramyl pentapeptide synthase
MPVNSRLVRPTIAMVMNIAPAHLEYHHTTDEIARKKSAIFIGMEAGGYAILYHEMKEFPIFEQAAIEKQLNIVTFGEEAGADVRLLSYDLASGQVVAQVFDQEYQYKQGAPGLHMVLNSLAVIAAISVSGQTLDKVLLNFETFKPVAGRGSFQKVKIDQIEISLLDETYNANPISMRAMMALCGGAVTGQGRRVIILGDMLELGVDAEQYHKDLLEPLLKAKPDCVLLCGVLMKSLWQLLPPDLSNNWFESVEILEQEVVGLLQDKDWVAIKSSNGTGLNRLVYNLVNR